MNSTASTGRRRGAVLATAFIVGVVVTIFAIQRLKAPSYAGRSLDQWLASLGDGQLGTGLLCTDIPLLLRRRYPEQSTAFAAMAPASLPRLSRDLMNYRTNWIDAIVARYGASLARIGITHNPPGVRSGRAALALAMSGPAVTNLLPNLFNAADSTEDFQRVAWVLLSSDRTGKEYFMARLANAPSPWLVTICAWGLSQFGTNASDALTLLLPHLQNDQGSGIVAWSASRISDDATVLVPALIPLLDNPVRYVRNGAVGSLSRLGPKAKAAVPALVESIGRVDPSEREFQLQNLFKIDSAEARRLGYQGNGEP